MVGGKVLTLVQVEVVGLNQGLGLVLAGRLKETKIFRDESYQAYTSSTLSESFYCICYAFVFPLYLYSLLQTWTHGQPINPILTTHFFHRRPNFDW